MKFLDAESALYAAMHPELAGWTREAYLMADIYDAARAVEWTVAAANSKRRPSKPKPYPRPKAKKKLKLGRGAVKLREFDSWWDGGVENGG